MFDSGFSADRSEPVLHGIILDVDDTNTELLGTPVAVRYADSNIFWFLDLDPHLFIGLIRIRITPDTATTDRSTDKPAKGGGVDSIHLFKELLFLQPKL